MRRIKHTVFLILALLPLAAYLFAVFRSGTVPRLSDDGGNGIRRFRSILRAAYNAAIVGIGRAYGYDGSSGLCLDYRVLRRSDTRVSGVFALYVPDYHFHG